MARKEDVEPGAAILDEDDARGLVDHFIQSKAWWVIPLVGERATSFAETLEARVYAGYPADFALMLASPGSTMGVAGLAFGRKTRCGARRLAHLMVHVAGSGEAVRDLERRLATQDVVLICEEASAAEIVRVHEAMYLLHRWLGRSWTDEDGNPGPPIGAQG